MRRLNPKTNNPFKRGDKREEDGFIFKQYRLSRPVKKNGYYGEDWRNPEAIDRDREYNKKYHEINKEKMKEYLTKYYEENKEKVKENIKKYQKNNRAKINAHHAKRRAKKLQAGTKYFRDLYKEQVEVYYLFAKVMKKMMGEDMHVDHIIPLQGKKVSGLHIPNNLQILPASINMRKSNKF